MKIQDRIYLLQYNNQRIILNLELIKITEYSFISYIIYINNNR